MPLVVRPVVESPTGVGDRHRWVWTVVPAQRCHRRQRTVVPPSERAVVRSLRQGSGTGTDGFGQWSLPRGVTDGSGQWSLPRGVTDGFGQWSLPSDPTVGASSGSQAPGRGRGPASRGGCPALLVLLLSLSLFLSLALSLSLYLFAGVSRQEALRMKPGAEARSSEAGRRRRQLGEAAAAVRRRRLGGDNPRDAADRWRPGPRACLRLHQCSSTSCADGRYQRRQVWWL